MKEEQGQGQRGGGGREGTAGKPVVAGLHPGKHLQVTLCLPIQWYTFQIFIITGNCIQSENILSI